MASGSRIAWIARGRLPVISRLVPLGLSATRDVPNITGWQVGE
jgi:hypothetical protein